MEQHTNKTIVTIAITLAATSILAIPYVSELSAVDCEFSN
jgi:hypothetical protein